MERVLKVLEDMASNLRIIAISNDVSLVHVDLDNLCELLQYFYEKGFYDSISAQGGVMKAYEKRFGSKWRDLSEEKRDHFIRLIKSFLDPNNKSEFVEVVP